MTETINSYDGNTASFTVQALNLLPNPDNPGHSKYYPVVADELGRASPQIRIQVLAIGGAPVFGDYSQGLPSDQSFDIVVNKQTDVLVDTGSFNTVLPESLFGDLFKTKVDLSTYPDATVSYSSDGNTGTGKWVPMKIGITATDGTQLITEIPVVVQTSGTTNYMMGVGFNIGRGIAGSMPDTSTYANAFLNMQPTAAGTPSRGYVIDGTGIHIGLDTGDTATSANDGWALQKLQPSARTVPAGAPPDWQPPTISGTLDYPADGTTPAASKTISPAGLLMDTGVVKTFIKTHDGLATPPKGAQVSLNLFGTDGQVRYGYAVDGNSPQTPTTTDKYPSVVTGIPDLGRPNLLNTGVHFLNGFDYLYDADNGYVGVRQNAATGTDLQVTPLIAVSGDYPMPDGFKASAPLYLSGNSRILASGTATLAGGVEGPGTLTLATGTLVLSGSSAAASLLLEPGTVLRAPGSLALARLDANGHATLEVASGATVQAVAGFVPPVNGLGYGLLTVTGGGTLTVGSLSVESGHSVLAGTIAGLNGATISSFVPGDLIEVNGSDARSTPVTARYDAGSGALLITAAGQTATVHLASPPAAATSFTVRTDANGGTLVQLTAATGQGASDALGATALRAAGGPTGAGVTVGVISISNNTLGGLAQDIANGDLPADTEVLNDPSGVSTDEGRAMAQLIHTIAPGASIKLYSATGLDNGQDVATAIDQLVAHGAKVIVDDMSVESDRMYQEGGPVAEAIARAKAAGVVMVTSAGDSGINYYEHAVSLEPTTLPDINGTVQAFNFGQGSNPYLEEMDLKPTGQGNVELTLGWTQPGDSPAYQLRTAIFTKNADGTYTKTQDVPYRQATGNRATVSMPIANSANGGTFYVALYSTAPVALEDQLFKLTVHHEGDSHVFSDPNADKGSGSIYGHALDPNEITAGAIYYRDAENAGSSASKPEAFSTSGPGTYLLDAAGNRESVTLSKPDVSGVDGVHNDVSGVDQSFYGTSASAPTVAAVAALMLQANPNLTPAQVKAMLKQSALPTDSPLQGGSGLVRADAAVALAMVDAARPVLAFSNSTTGEQGTAKMDAVAAGGPDYLQWQYIATGSDSMAFAIQASDVFIHGGVGADAIAVTSGRNVVDGGGGSNFMVGGTGADTFFTDARSAGVGWNTIVNFQAGDAVTLWGFDTAVSSYCWDDAPAGTDGYQGATLRANIVGGAGRASDGIDASITFAGMGVDQAKAMLHSTGDIPGGAGKYLYIYNQGV